MTDPDLNATVKDWRLDAQGGLTDEQIFDGITQSQRDVVYWLDYYEKWGASQYSSLRAVMGDNDTRIGKALKLDLPVGVENCRIGLGL